MKKRLYSFIYYRLLGWKTNVTVPNYDKCVICAAPHTSNWDLFIGKLFLWSHWTKDQLYDEERVVFFSFGTNIQSHRRHTGRPKPETSLVDQMANRFAGSKLFHLAITPEGTQSQPKLEKGIFTSLR